MTIADRLDALDELVALARPRLDGPVVDEAERIAGKAGDRMRFGAGHTVVALAGATGSGKSSLFNALAGEPLAAVGLRRPTTSSAQAAVWGSEQAGDLLDWLGVPRRHLLTAASRSQAATEFDEKFDEKLDGLVLLDLPDVDSVEQRHRIEADRLVEHVDMLIWVLDPQKYADAALHDRYLAPLAGHADVMQVVFNQIDRLSDEARRDCLEDLEKRLAIDGLKGVPVAATSTRTGEGIARLRADLAARATAKRASVRRLEADLSALAAQFESTCGGTTSKPSRRPKDPGRGELVAALGAAAGVDVVAEAVASSHRLRARRATGWPFTRWTARLRLDPARRLRLRAAPSELVRTSLPASSAVQRARVDSALRELADRSAEGLPEPWPTVVRRAATGSRSQLPDLLDRAVAGADLGVARSPRWWRVAGLTQWALAGVAVAGLAWLAVLFVLAWLQLPDPPLPWVGDVPVPTLMLIAGLIAGFLLALLSRSLANSGARRAARIARRRVGERVAAVADEQILGPVTRELEAHTQLCEALARVRS